MALGIGDQELKTLKSLFPILLICAAAFGQTQDLGLGAFANERGAILLAVDAALVDFQLDRSYVMFERYCQMLCTGRN